MRTFLIIITGLLHIYLSIYLSIRLFLIWIFLWHYECINVTFDQFNALFLNKTLFFLKKVINNVTHSKHLNTSVYDILFHTLYLCVPGDSVFILDPSWTNISVTFPIRSWRSLYSSYSAQKSSLYLCRSSASVIVLYFLEKEVPLVN